MVTCDTTGVLFTGYDNAEINGDIDLIYSRLFLPQVSGYQYMNDARVNLLLHALDLTTGDNEFHQNWRELQLTYNYFHRTDSTAYYGTFGGGNPNMRFFASDSTISLSERNHVDIYLVHSLDPDYGYDYYPITGGRLSNIQEDGSPTVCDEYDKNSIQSAAGFSSSRNLSNPFAVDTVPDSTWYLGGKHTVTRLNHEFQHLLFASSKGQGMAFPNEMFSMAAEYLSGAHERDAQKPLLNVTYDQPIQFFSGPHLQYEHWYLWMAYLAQQFAGDTMRIEDDLLYKYVRHRKTPTVFDQTMHGLELVLDSTAVDLGSSGRERLRNIFHNYSLAKWINNPSPQYYNGRYGFGRGLVPSESPGFFRSDLNPRDRHSAVEVPPKYRVGLAQAAMPCSLQSHRWCFTDRAQGSSGADENTYCDSSGVYVYSADYLQFEADGAFEDAQDDTCHIEVRWDSTRYPDIYPGGANDRLNLKVTALTYPLRSDSLYRYGAQVISVIDGVVDTLAGRCSFSIPGFGGAVKSIVVVLDLGEEWPSAIYSTGTILPYDYSFWVTPHRGGAITSIALTAFKPSGATKDSLAWTDTANWGAGGYYVRRSDGTPNSPAVIDSLNPGEYLHAYTPPGGQTPSYYSVVPKFNPYAGVSNLATTGGQIDQTQTLSGNLYVSGDVTINAGDTLNVAPGARVSFRPHFDSLASGTSTSLSEFVVNGNLCAVGTAADSIVWESAGATPSPGDWRGIKLNSPGAASRLEYNVIRHGYHGLQAVNAGATQLFKIFHSRVQHSQMYGIYVDGGYPEIQYSVLEQNHAAELAVTGYGQAMFWHNYLRYSPSLGSGAVDDGAVFTTAGVAFIRWSTIKGVGMGLYCVGPGSNPTMMGISNSIDSLKYGRNEVVDFQNYGVRAVDGALPSLGISASSTSFFAGRNNIYTTVAPSAKFLTNTDTASVYARWNYWGANPPDTARFTGKIIGITSQYQTSAESPAGAGYSPVAPLIVQDGGDERAMEQLELALERELSHDESSATTAYRELIQRYPDDPVAPAALAHLVALRVRMGGAGEEVAELDGLTQTTAPRLLRHTARRMRPQLLMKAGRTQEGLAAYDELLADPEFDRSSVLFDLALQKGLVLGDAKSARETVAEFLASGPDPALVRHSRAMLEELVGADAWPKASSGSTEASSDANLSAELEQSYPNPMNPSSRIAFRVPAAGRATMRIFDVQGRTVRTLADGTFAPGRYVVVWDGRNVAGNPVASGVYYYRLDFGGRHFVRKTIVLK